MAEVQDYTSAYEGAQMDQAFERILGMKLGSITITAQSDGSAYAEITFDGDYSSRKKFCSANCISSGAFAGEVGAFLDYISGTSGYARIYGDGVLVGRQYRFDYMLIE